MRISARVQHPVFHRMIRFTLFSVAFAWVGCSSNVFAQEATPANAAVEGETEAGADQPGEEEKRRPILDLGSFKINDLRPTRNETAKLTFSMHLAFSKSLSEQQLKELEHWKHRLRDQVITAVRISTIKDFQEPDLSRLSRNVLIRVNRLFEINLAEEVLLTEYLFRTH